MSAPADSPAPADESETLRSGSVDPSAELAAVAKGLPSTELPADATADTTSYKVSLDIFEGPMDLLLYLIKKDEIDIYDIQIERITKQYMGYLDTLKLLNVGLAGEFLVMAANLCYIKSRMMLP
ncbi:MAG: segregation/condensation protein A, partial [Verrucomicrobiota bacterium]